MVIPTTAPTARPRPLKIGIGCVYFYGPESEWILELQLRNIARTLAGYDYKVYAGANRLQSDLRRKLDAREDVKVIPLPHFEGQGGAEHAFYLDLLLERASEEGCEYLAALDSDSFPILPDWPAVLIRQMGRDVRFAAVLRSENRDTYLPHPCGYFMHRSFLLDHKPHMLPRDRDLDSEAFRKFLRQTNQRVDTGIGYGYALWKQNEPWLRLTRTNRRNPHFLMAGIYGNVFFHLGASSRRPTFHVDYLTRPSLRLATAIQELRGLWRIAASLESRYIAANVQVFDEIVACLKRDPDRYLSSLGAPDSQATHIQ